MRPRNTELVVAARDGVAAHLEHEAFGAGKQIVEIETVFLGDGADRRAGGDDAEERQADCGTAMVDELDGPSRVLLALDQALLLESLEMAHDAVGRLDLEGLADDLPGKRTPVRRDRGRQHDPVVRTAGEVTMGARSAARRMCR